MLREWTTTKLTVSSIGQPVAIMITANYASSILSQVTLLRLETIPVCELDAFSIAGSSGGGPIEPGDIPGLEEDPLPVSSLPTVVQLM